MPSRRPLPLDPRKWFDRMLPQTLQVATWFLYFRGGFAALDYLEGNDLHGTSRHAGGAAALVAPAALAAHIAAGFLMANSRRAGWYLGLAAAFSPAALRFLLVNGSGIGLGWTWIVTQDNLVTFALEATLAALLLHPMSRTHARRWFA